MKNTRWISNLKQSLVPSTTRKTRRKRRTTNCLAISELEQRNLLAAVSFDAGAGSVSFLADADQTDIVSLSAPTANSLQIQVGAGDSLVLEGNAVGNSAFVLSQNVVADDTLTINLNSVSIDELDIDLFNLDDVFTVTGTAGIESVTVSGGIGNDELDASSLTDGIMLFGNVGDDILTGGSGDDTLGGGPGFDQIVGGDGVDFNSFQGIAFGVTATVNADGTGSATYSTNSETFTGIENLTGSESNDVLTATGAVSNELRGAGGDDILRGGGGQDTISGGDGIDTNSFQGIGFGVTATVNDDGTGTASYGSVSETFVGIESLTGSENDDVLTATGSASNVLRGEGGDDILAGGAGTDTIDGGAGIDTNSFAGIGFGVTATINANGSGTASYGSVSETFTNIENLVGSDQGDNLTGNNLDNVIDGGLGDDTIFGLGGDDILSGGEGTDVIDGGTGNDTNSFAGISSGVTAIINNADGDGTAVHGDVSETFFNIENLTGTDFEDDLTGNDLVNVLDGGLDDDIIAGRGGNDRIIGGFGDDNLNGDAGSDTIIGGSDDGSIAPESGFALNLFDQPLRSLTTSQTPTQLVNQAAAGNLYFNVHTNEFSGGEIRGQLDLQSDTVVNGVRILTLTADLDGAQEPDAASDSEATGEGTVRIEVDGSEVLYFATLAVDGISTDELLPVSEFSAIHIHNAAAGVNGPVIVDVIQGAGGDIEGNAVNPIFDTGDGNIFEEVIESDNDILNGGAGNDNLSGGIGNDILRGGSGNDVANGGEGNDDLNGDVGNDTLNGGAGNDHFVGSTGIDTINGGSGTDTNSFQGISVGGTATVNSDGTGTASFGSENETFVGIENLTGSDNADVLTAVGNAGAILRGLDGNDTLTGGGGVDRLIGNAGNDILRGAAGNDSIVGGSGNDSLNGGAGDDTLSGEAGNDFLVGGAGRDLSDGGAGLDTKSFENAAEGVDVRINSDGTGSATEDSATEFFSNIERLLGSENDDVLIATGDRGTEILGLGGNDLLIGSFGEDRLLGGEGADTLNGRAGNDVIFGGLGDDTVNAGSGDDFVRGNEGDDTISGGDGNDRITGSEGADALFGNAGNDFIFGDIGFDELFGGEGDDELRGGDGDDTLFGGPGTDLLIGGFGTDSEVQ